MLSAIVIAKNEESLITNCLNSLSFVDEIIVVDNDSSDGTSKVAKKFTDKIYDFHGADFAKLRNFAMEKAKGDWILYIDADERVLNPLAEEIQKVIQENKISALALSRKNIIFGTPVNYGPFWPDWVIRLFKREDFEEWIGMVHEYGKFKGKLGYSKNSLLHLTHRDVDHIVLKSLEWSKIDAGLRLEANHPAMNSWRFLRILFSELFNQGIKRRGFFAGTVGTMDALMQTFSMIITYIRLWQLQQLVPIDQKYKEIDAKLEQDRFEFRP